MAHLLRLISFTLALLLSNSAFAAIEPTFEYKAEGCPWGGDFPTSWTSSRQAACGQVPNACAQLQGVSSNVIVFVEGHYCQAQTAGGGILGSISIQTRSACPTNSISNGSGGCSCATNYTDQNGVCVRNNPCPAGQVEQGGACVPENCKPDEIRVAGICVKEPACPVGQTRVNGICKNNGCEPGKVVGDRQAGYTCEGGCTVKTNPSVCVTVNGVADCWGTGRLTGGTCTPGDGGGDTPGNGDGDGGGDGDGDGDGGNGDGDGDGDGPGTGPGGGGTGDGDGDGDGDPDTPPGGGTNPDTGEPSTPGTGGGTGPGGGSPLPTPVTEEPNEQGECPPGYRPINNGIACVKVDQPPDGDGKCPAGMVKVGTTCKSTEPAGGDGDGDGGGDDSMFSGSCMAGFVCEGDAIQCSIAREQHRRACKLFDDKSPESDLYDKEKGKEGEQTKDLPGNREETMANRISTADAFGSGQCIQDLSVIVGGQSISLPLSKICPSLAIIGNIMVAVSLLLAIRIVGRG